MLFFLFWEKGTVTKTSVQQIDHSSSAAYMFAAHRLLIFALNVITAKRHYRYYGITASCVYRPHGIPVEFFPSLR